jgi:CHRD domain-containing protein
MRTRLFAAIPIAAIALAILAVAVTGSASAGGRPLHGDLSGSNEVPPVSTGDPNGSGTADLTLNQGQGRICLDVETQNISTPILQHIHKGVAGTNGPIVVDFTPLLAGGGDGCVSAARALVKDIRKHPEQYYFNVHSTEFPGGAVRGQLEK